MNANSNKGMYYLRTRPAADAIKFTVDLESLLSNSNIEEIKSSGIKNIMQMRKKNDSNAEKNISEEETKLDSKEISPTKKKQPNRANKNEPMFEMCFNCGS